MGLIEGKNCRLCRARSKKLFLKGERCLSTKCPLYTKPATSGSFTSRVRSPRKRRISDYGVQLREKQGLKYVYAIDERTLRRCFVTARKTKQATGEVMIQLLESRLDNLVFRLGFAVSRQMARQIVGHRHVTVDGKIVNIPSCQIKPGSVISLDSLAMKIPDVHKLINNKDFVVPDWLERKAAIGKFTRLPKREEIELDVNEQVIVEFYSR